MISNDDKYTLMMEALAELQPEMEEARRSRPLPARSSLDHVLAEFGPMPREALFLGIASDELPVLLNLHDPVPGPLLIAGDPGAGKTSLLQTIAHAAGKMHEPEDVQFGVLTGQVEEWSELETSDHAVGIFNMKDHAAEDFILSLASWAHGNKSSRKSVLLLLDDLEAVTELGNEAVHNLRWLLLRGPSRRVWPIITLSTQHLEKMKPWLEAFRTRILGRARRHETIQQLEAEQANLSGLNPGTEFVMREGAHWLNFWIPTLE